MSVMDLSGVIASLASTAILTVRRKQAGAYVDGRWVEGPDSTFTTFASIQPMTGETTLLLPEAERTKDSVVVFTKDVLFPTDEENHVLADVLEYKGDLYRVLIVDDWSQSGNLFRSIAVKVLGS